MKPIYFTSKQYQRRHILDASMALNFLQRTRLRVVVLVSRQSIFRMIHTGRYNFEPGTCTRYRRLRQYIPEITYPNPR